MKDFLSKLGFGSSNESVDLDALMSQSEDVDVVTEPADFYVKPLLLTEDSAQLKEELTAGNVILLSIAQFTRNPARLKEKISEVTGFVESINGDIAKISDDKLLVTPARVKIVKNRRR